MSGQGRGRLPVTAASGELLPLAERVQRMQLFRMAVSGVVVLFALLAPETLGAGLSDLAVGIGAYVVSSLACQWWWHRSRGELVLFGTMLAVDGIFLAWASYVTGGTISPLRYLILLHLIAVSLLASRRAGLQLASWHTVLLLGIFCAQETEILGRASERADLLPGSNLQHVVWFVSVIWFVAMITGILSVVNERELRRRRHDLEALAVMAVDLEDATDPSSVAQVLLDSVVAAFDLDTVAVLAGQGEALSLMASRGTGQASATQHRPSAHSILKIVRESRRSQVVSDLNPEHDPWLASLFPSPRSLALLPLTAEGRSVGVLVVAHDLREDSLVERQMVSILERFTSHAALALRNAWLLEQLQTFASTDGLTGIANRRAFDLVLDRELARASRNETMVSLVMLDIDHFKDLNDTHGHQRGDDVLRAVAVVLAKACREYDTAARYGGEEFAMILPNCGPDEAFAAAERLRLAVAEAETEDGSALQVTISGGIATFPIHGRDSTAVVTAADAALYESKRKGRNRVTAPARSRPTSARRRGRKSAVTPRS
ncbi:MAG TPA: diguanylate cyclase [Acidimicrobiales bacterium]|nr:diguanylate cyclase [Acidimicrobiales bacterium]